MWRNHIYIHIKSFIRTNFCKFSKWIFPTGFTMIQIIGIVFCGTLISIMSLFFANHLITNPSAKTRKKIEKLELLEAAEIGVNRKAGSSRRSHSSTRVVRTPLDRNKLGSSVPRKIWQQYYEQHFAHQHFIMIHFKHF